MGKTADFWNRIADQYSRDPIKDMDAYEQTLDRVRHWLPARARVLEIGCGTGTTALKLADAAEAYRGTDIALEMVRIARQKAKAAEAAHLSFEVASSRQAGAGAQFDAVTAFNILHLVDDVPGVLAHIRARLPDGGMFLPKTPCLGGKWWFLPLIGALRLFGKAPPHVGFLTPEGLEALVRAAGFEIVETGGYPPKLPNHFIAARAV